MAQKIIQVPMEDKLRARLDAFSKREGRSRAEVIRAACLAYLRRNEEEELERIYVEGYRRIPEDPRLAEAMTALASEILPQEEW